MTPEGRIKQKIKLLLDSYDGNIYYFMPVQTGYGRRTVDFLGCAMGIFFAVEAKRPGGRVTPLQDRVIDEVRLARGFAFVVRDDETLNELRVFLERVVKKEYPL